MERAAMAAREMNCIKLRTQTLHDPAAYMRLTGAKPRIDLSGVRNNGKFYWVFEKEVH
jgi:hypothetical protein